MKSKNLFWGLFFIAAAGLIVVNQLGYLAGITTFKVAITIFLIPIIIRSSLKLNFFGIFFGMGLLGILFSRHLGINNFVPFPILLTALFLSIGFSMIFGKHTRHIENCNNNCFNNTENNENFEEVVNTEDADTINFGVKFGSSIKYVNAKNLKQANFSCSFGALKVYFDNATISPEGAEINFDISFSGVELYIPREWKVINGIEATLAGVEEKYKRNEKEIATVKLTGKANFSGVEIIYV